MHLLLVEDSRRLRESLGDGLSRSGYAVDLAADGEEGLRAARSNGYDVIILDIMLPKLDGLTVLQRLREGGDDSHVLLLTAKGEVEDRITGLRVGADDYLVKPFAFDELVARIEALVRRRYGTKNPTIEVGALSIDTVSRAVARGGESIELTLKEYALLEYLALRKGEAVRRMAIEDHLYSEHDFPMSNAVDRLVCSLRKKIETDDGAPLLRTLRGFGYMLGEPVEGEA